jgi:hypothetical protein
MSFQKYGMPFISPALNKVDKDKSLTDDERKYPDDTDVVMSYVKDVQKMIEADYPDTGSFKIHMDSMAIQMDNIMGLF